MPLCRPGTVGRVDASPRPPDDAGEAAGAHADALERDHAGASESSGSSEPIAERHIGPAEVSAPIEIDLVEGDIVAALADVTEVVHLAPGRDADLDGTGTEGVDVAGTARLFTAMAAAGIDRAVVLSSAMVYGPWPDNPIPLTESTPSRPHPDLGFAIRKADVERRALEWEATGAGRTRCVLRPTITVSPTQVDWLSRSLWNAYGVAAEGEPPVQFLHIDDLVSAVVLAVEQRLRGVYNVAPDGWVTGERMRALAGRQARVEVPRRVVERVGVLRWITGNTTTPPEVTPYTLESWVVANDKLRAAGWEPTFTNSEAYVSAAPAGPLAMLGSARRQELALAAVGGAGALTAAAVGAGVAWARRR